MNDALRQLAMKLLARREHSRAELEQKLSRFGSDDEVTAVLDRLCQTGLLSDARFAESYLRSHGARQGAARLRQALRRKGVAAEIAAASLAAADLPDEAERARTVWKRKFGAMPTDEKEWARQARFLQGRGFDTEIIRRLLKQVKDEA